MITMTTERKVPKATLQRYPVYLKALRKLKADGETKIMSRQLADYVSITTDLYGWQFYAKRF